MNADLHGLVRLDGSRHAGKVFVRKVHHFCNKPSCPVCFKSGWAVREAGNIEARLLEVAKRFGAVEHIVCSVPVADYDLDFKVLRKKAIKVLKSRGIFGGVLIFHGFRYNLEKHWFWSPHWHVLGIVFGGYGKCRGCARKWNCLSGCGGFDDRAYRLFLKDGYFVKVLGERKTIFGTAWYQLNHSSYRNGVERFHISTWFGVASYRKMKVKAEKRLDLCPICKHDLVWIDYFGSKRFCTDRHSREYQSESLEDLREDGRVVWSESVKSPYHSVLVGGKPEARHCCNGGFEDLVGHDY